MTAAMVEASCSATMRSRSSASSAPCSGSPRVKALRARSWVWRHVIDAGQQRAEHLAVGDDAADRDAAEIDAVIAALAADQAEARAVALGAVIGERDLERGLDRLRAGVGEEDMVDARRHDGDEARGQLEGLRVAHLEGRRVVELARPALAIASTIFGRQWPALHAPQARRCRRAPGGRRRWCSACPRRATNMRGAFLNCRFAVNGIQKASRLLVETCVRGMPRLAKLLPPIRATARAGPTDCAGGPFHLGGSGEIS